MSMSKRNVSVILLLGFIFVIASALYAQLPPPPIKDIKERPRLVGSMTIVEPPTPGRTWMAGGGVLCGVRWTRSGLTPSRVKIEIVDADCTTVRLTAVADTANDGEERIVLPASFPPGTYKLRISGSGTPAVAVTACSSAFPIVTYPFVASLPAGSWRVGSAYTITWTTTEPAGVTMNWFLRPTDHNVDQMIVKSSTPNDGTESLTIPVLAPGSYSLIFSPGSGTYAGQEFPQGRVTIIR
jgi:hypothetical protein